MGADPGASPHSDGREWWSATQDTLAEVSGKLDSTDLIITIGGDGTILRGAHEAAPRDIPLLGINMGRVGFMSEIGHETEPVRRLMR